MGWLSKALSAGVDHGVTHHNTPTLGCFEPGDTTQDRGLPTPRSAQQGVELPGLDREAHTLDRPHGASSGLIRHVQVFDDEGPVR
jgi:hypothetical protein